MGEEDKDCDNQLFWNLQQCFERGSKSVITTYVQMTFYLVNNYFVHRIKANATSISEGAPLSTPISQTFDIRYIGQQLCRKGFNLDRVS